MQDESFSKPQWLSKVYSRFKVKKTSNEVGNDFETVTKIRTKFGSCPIFAIFGKLIIESEHQFHSFTVFPAKNLKFSSNLKNRVKVTGFYRN